MRWAIKLVGVSILALTGCEMGAKSVIGFTLPEGNVAAGQVAFIHHQCTACHSIVDLDLPAADTPGPASVSLGGKVSSVRTYGQLLTSIINPSHKLAPGYPHSQVSANGESMMRNYNDVMTVKELTDLVAFLQIQYEIVVPPYYYRPY